MEYGAQKHNAAYEACVYRCIGPLRSPFLWCARITEQGETVRSYGEKQISNFFTRNNIRYIYEPDTKKVLARPDFDLPDYDVYVEYWGLVNADDPSVKNQYVKKMKRKMVRYHSNKIRFISIYPDNLKNLDWIFRKKFEDATGTKFLH